MGRKESKQKQKTLTLAVSLIFKIWLPVITFEWNIFLNTQKTGKTSENLMSGPQVIKLFSCSTQLSTEFQLLIKTKILTNKEFCFKSLVCKNTNNRWNFNIMSRIHFGLSWVEHEKSLITLGPDILKRLLDYLWQLHFKVFLELCLWFHHFLESIRFLVTHRRHCWCSRRSSWARVYTQDVIIGHLLTKRPFSSLHTIADMLQAMEHHPVLK